MALTVEDGTGLESAESYASVVDADSYHSRRNNTEWAAASTAEKEAALRLATAYIDGKYRHKWAGARVKPVLQALEWPRTGVIVGNLSAGSYFFDAPISGGQYYPLNKIPLQVKQATMAAALRALSGPLVADYDGGVIREKIGPMETEFAATGERGTVYREIDFLVSWFLKSSMVSDVVRG